jgi:glycosyltransferase involved in cell wall biosynthesis
MSLPAVAFDCGGPKEIISEGYNGFLVEAESVREFAEKLLTLINDDALREQMSQNAFEESKKYKINNIVDQWENLIESL